MGRPRPSRNGGNGCATTVESIERRQQTVLTAIARRVASVLFLVPPNSANTVLWKFSLARNCTDGTRILFSGADVGGRAADSRRRKEVRTAHRWLEESDGHRRWSGWQNLCGHLGRERKSQRNRRNCGHSSGQSNSFRQRSRPALRDRSLSEMAVCGRSKSNSENRPQR